MAKQVYNPTPTSIVLPLPPSRRTPWQLGLVMVLLVVQAIDQGVAAIFRPLLGLAASEADRIDRAHLLLQLLWMLPLTALLAALPLGLRNGRRRVLWLAFAVEAAEAAVRAGVLAAHPVTLLPIGPYVAIAAAALAAGLLLTRPARAFCDR